MIVVAIIGVLAALAIYGVRKYLASAKTSEAKNNVGAITRGSVAAYERETTSNELLPDGQSSTATVHQLCGTSTAVPAAAVANKKYQPNTNPTTGDWAATGTSPLPPSAGPASGSTSISPSPTRRAGGAAAPCSAAGGYTYGEGDDANGFEVVAVGDIDGNTVFSHFVRGGTVRNGTVVLSTEMFIQNEFE